ncbi:hypothetical protein WOLCODRAFT_165031 [Wolfiporia cocos MD-104 SS10]|uniref:Uncharacterized protein n=1 Tax=Wolfiporia cocos (strain MD-104) TaxID=742152 RepID=A0A2H3K760_WOLCO|nr:hypothetical protein WOLCODRAFT_165031 [Wolfiporia cocos MD-104 SS10]
MQSASTFKPARARASTLLVIGPPLVPPGLPPLATNARLARPRSMSVANVAKAPGAAKTNARPAMDRMSVADGEVHPKASPMTASGTERAFVRVSGRKLSVSESSPTKQSLASKGQLVKTTAEVSAAKTDTSTMGHKENVPSFARPTKTSASRVSSAPLVRSKLAGASPGLARRDALSRKATVTAKPAEKKDTAGRLATVANVKPSAGAAGRRAGVVKGITGSQDGPIKPSKDDVRKVTVTRNSKPNAAPVRCPPRPTGFLTVPEWRYGDDIPRTSVEKNVATTGRLAVKRRAAERAARPVSIRPEHAVVDKAVRVKPSKAFTSVLGGLGEEEEEEEEEKEEKEEKKIDEGQDVVSTQDVADIVLPVIVIEEVAEEASSAADEAPNVAAQALNLETQTATLEEDEEEDMAALGRLFAKLPRTGDVEVNEDEDMFALPPILIAPTGSCEGGSPVFSSLLESVGELASCMQEVYDEFSFMDDSENDVKLEVYDEDKDVQVNDVDSVRTLGDDDVKVCAGLATVGSLECVVEELVSVPETTAVDAASNSALSVLDECDEKVDVDDEDQADEDQAVLGRLFQQISFPDDDDIDDDEDSLESWDAYITVFDEAPEQPLDNYPVALQEVVGNLRRLSNGKDMGEDEFRPPSQASTIHVSTRGPRSAIDYAMTHDGVKLGDAEDEHERVPHKCAVVINVEGEEYRLGWENDWASKFAPHVLKAVSNFMAQKEYGITAYCADEDRDAFQKELARVIKKAEEDGPPRLTAEQKKKGREIIEDQKENIQETNQVGKPVSISKLTSLFKRRKSTEVSVKEDKIYVYYPECAREFLVGDSKCLTVLGTEGYTSARRTQSSSTPSHSMSEKTTSPLSTFTSATQRQYLGVPSAHSMHPTPSCSEHSSAASNISLTSTPQPTFWSRLFGHPSRPTPAPPATVSVTSVVSRTDSDDTSDCSSLSSAFSPYSSVLASSDESLPLPVDGLAYSATSKSTASQLDARQLRPAKGLFRRLF